MITDEQFDSYLKLKEEYGELEEYILAVVRNKRKDKLTWADIAEIINDVWGEDKSETFYRKHYSEYQRDFDEQERNQKKLDEKFLEIKKERVNLSDERIQNNAYIRQMARDERVKEIALAIADKMNKEKRLSSFDTLDFIAASKANEKEEKEALLCISDWHYGIEIKNAWNEYSPDIAVKRINKLTKQVITKCTIEGVRKLTVFNLSDLIAGRIHWTIRLQSREDVISQIIHVSELLAEMLYELSKHFEVNYYSCFDNHSRLEPNKHDALDAESLCKITDWYLKSRLEKSVNFFENEFGPDIITCEILGHPVLGVHGHKDKPAQTIDSISRLTHKHFDLISTAHLHHFSSDEKNETVIVSNGALMGTDDYAANLRLSSLPSQNLIIITKRNVIDQIHRIVLQ